MNSGVASTGSNCTGGYGFDLNDWIQNDWDGSLAPGAEIYARTWARDLQSPSHSGFRTQCVSSFIPVARAP